MCKCVKCNAFTHSHICDKMQSLWIEPATLTHASQTITPLTKAARGKGRKSNACKTRPRPGRFSFTLFPKFRKMETVGYPKNGQNGEMGGISPFSISELSLFPLLNPPHRVSFFGESFRCHRPCFKRVKLGEFPPRAHFVRCVMVWASGVKVLGSIPTGDILAQMCECVNALRVMHLHIL